MKRFSQRPIEFRRILRDGDQVFKVYSITLPGEPFEAEHFDEPIRSFRDDLPSADTTVERPGVGFIICHAGLTADYLIGAWWDHENELPILIFVREPGQNWRPARSDEGVCVWDLQVIAFERDAYVETYLSGTGLEEWLERTLAIDASE